MAVTLRTETTRFTYTPIPDPTDDPNEDPQIDLGWYAPGIESDIAGKWGRHVIPGQSGSLKEDLGDGDLKSKVTLQFIGAAKGDYESVMTRLSKRRRGTLFHPRRGARDSIIERIHEKVRYTESGEATFVDVYFEDAVIGAASSFKGGHTFGTIVGSQSSLIDDLMAFLKAAIFAKTNLQARALAVVASNKVTAATTEARAYVALATEAFSLGLYDPSIQARLRGLPPLTQAAIESLRAVGPAANIQDCVLGLEVMLSAATQFDAFIRSASPIPITTEITRSPGQSIYQLVQSKYGRSGKSPAQMRNLVSLILRLNPQIRRPSLILCGELVVRPA